MLTHRFNVLEKVIRGDVHGRPCPRVRFGGTEPDEACEGVAEVVFEERLVLGVHLRVPLKVPERELNEKMKFKFSVRALRCQVSALR